MGRNAFTLIVYAMIGLAVVGLLFSLLNDAAGFFGNMLISLGIGLAICAVVYLLFFRNRTTTSSDTRKYKQAVKQSKAKYKQNYQNASTSTVNQQRKQTNPLKKKSHKRPRHLRVIDGNKSKRKKRVSN
ncbi:SA1362 family protein [Ornithinibacillus halophilus]|uniref:Uncharacterized protein n=1 Tax=Ornithinibacillus halophilus TaxID=930117 RepID=A0A1M5CZT7_9BACI|nr:SA1362 family protein [Ornithinibacillus halophilus]SHF60167.1 hypothetical protein SAMN05216225_1001459 [Ornithinibacillus halophilus]